MDRNHTQSILKAAYEHEGSALIEIYQNCNVFNDKAFIQLTGKEERVHNRIDLEHGKPVVFDEGAKAVVMRGGEATIVDSSSVDPKAIVVHDETRPDPSTAFALSRLSHGPYGPTPLGVFRNVERPVYDQEVQVQLETAKEKLGEGDLEALIRSHGTWTVEANSSNGG